MNETISLSEIPSGAIKLALNLAVTQILAPDFFAWLSRLLTEELKRRMAGDPSLALTPDNQRHQIVHISTAYPRPRLSSGA